MSCSDLAGPPVQFRIESEMYADVLQKKTIYTMRVFDPLGRLKNLNRSALTDSVQLYFV